MPTDESDETDAGLAAEGDSTRTLGVNPVKKSLKISSVSVSFAPPGSSKQCRYIVTQDHSDFLF